MTNNKVKEFLEKVADDEEWQRKVQRLKDLEGVIRVAKSAIAKDQEGFPFTVEEWKEEVKKVKRKRDEIRDFVNKTGGLLNVPPEVLALDYFPENLV